jgi:hypothetical protein
LPAKYLAKTDDVLGYVDVKWKIFCHRTFGYNECLKLCLPFFQVFAQRHLEVPMKTGLRPA